MNCFAAEDFRKLVELAFPFHFGFDHAQKITRVGKSLAKVQPELRVGSHLSEQLQFDGAAEAAHWDDVPAESPDRPLVVRLKVAGMLLRGQLCRLQHEILFLANPWQLTIDSLKRWKLTCADFALHDPAIDNLFAQKIQSVQLDDLQRMIQSLEADAHDRKRWEDAEKAIESDLSAAADIRIRFSRDGMILEVRSVLEDFLPEPACRLVGKHMSTVIAEFDELMTQARTWFRQQTQPFRLDYQHLSPMAEYYFEGRLTSTSQGDYFLLARDVSQRKELARRLQHRSTHDGLTELPNRELFAHRLGRALAEDSLSAVMLLDLDDFKAVNDSLGHVAGDELLQIVATRVGALMRPEADVAARLGGDEFGVLVTGLASPESALAIGERLLRRVCAPITLSNQCVIDLTGSVGIAVSNYSRNPSVLFRSADLAMHEAKNSRKNSVVVFQPKLYEAFAERLRLKREIESGLVRREFVPFYQPIVEFNTGAIHGWEALARWEHPERGLLPPSVFIELAEQSGMVIELGDQILERSCLAGRSLAARTGSLQNMHVNLSPVQIQRSDVVQLIKRVLEDTSVPRQSLTLEITETTLFSDIMHAEKVLREIKDLGVRIALDDFGVGYSSLRYLERFPIDVLKLDRSFVSRVSDPTCRGYRLLRPIIQLGMALDLQIVAEGIETVEQGERMRDLGCHQAQGYYYGPPMPLDDVVEFLEAGLPVV